MSEKKGRIEWIDSIKGFAIITVVLGHVVKGYYDSSLFAESENLLRTLYQLIYMFHMPLFVFVSGFVFFKAYYSSECLKPVLKKNKYLMQLINLLILYIFYSYLLWGTKSLLGDYVNKQVSARDGLLILVKPIQLYWYLFVLIILYLLFAIPGILNVNGYILLAVLAVISITPGFIPDDFLSGVFQIRRVLYYSFFFYLGVFCAGNNISTKLRRIIIAILGVIGICVAIVFFNADVFIYDLPFVRGIVALGLIGIIVELFVSIKWFGKCRLLTTLGKRTLEIYLLHTYFATFLRVAMQKAGVNNIFVCLVVNTLVSIIAPFCVSVFLEKIHLWGLFFKPVSLFYGGKEKHNH